MRVGSLSGQHKLKCGYCEQWSWVLRHGTEVWLEPAQEDTRRRFVEPELFLGS